MQLFTLEKIKNNRCYFYEDDISHILKVLRKKINDIIHVKDQNGVCYEVKIISTEPFNVEVIKILNCENNSNRHICLYMAVIKKANFELVVQKAVEIHVNEIIPVYFNRSQTSNKIDISRIKKIIQEACKQSNCHHQIKIIEPITFDNLLNMINNNQLKLLAYEKEKCDTINNVKCFDEKIINLIVGPEGGFNQYEIDKLLKVDNLHSIKLTNNILRAETAAIYLLSNVINKWGE